jgi:hypothetical protein
MVRTTRWWLIWLAIVAGLIALIVLLARPADPQQMATRMQSQIAQIRGLQFKRDVVIQEQSPTDFRKHAEGLLQRVSVPEKEQVLRTLGLLASDETFSVDTMGKHLQSGPTGNYDPYSARLFVVKTPERLQQGVELDEMYARELYRALLDQHFDLKTYLEQPKNAAGLNHDQWLARLIVVESEVTYAALLRGVKQKMGRIPDYLPIEQAIERKVDTDVLVDTVNDPRMPRPEGAPRKPRRKPDRLPTYFAELIKAIQRDGLVFVHQARLRGWKEVDKLYTTSPPLSTEQVLHPHKWLGDDRPVQIQWPAFEQEPAFADWELVEQNVLGELLMRTIYRVHHLSPMMGSEPNGWGGDRYAVLKRRDSGDMVLLMYTVWDRESDATAFAENYRVVMKEKYAEVSQPVRIVEEGHRVVIVEGGDESSIDAFMQFALSAQEIQDTAVEK